MEDKKQNGIHDIVRESTPQYIAWKAFFANDEMPTYVRDHAANYALALTTAAAMDKLQEPESTKNQMYVLDQLVQYALSQTPLKKSEKQAEVYQQ